MGRPSTVKDCDVIFIRTEQNDRVKVLRWDRNSHTYQSIEVVL